MAFDAHKNLAVSAVVTAPTPATSGTSLSVTAGEGQRFPVAPFNATVWPANAMPTPLTGEVIRVTARATDTLTIVRAQEGSTARTIGTGDLIAATITAKTLTDLETQAALLGQANQFTASPQTLGPVANPGLVFHDSGVPADARLFRIMNAFQYFRINALNDAQTVDQAAPLMLNRSGDAYIGRDLYEKARTTALGHWIAVPFSAGNYVSNAGAWTVAAGHVVLNTYTVIGKTLVWQWRVTGSTVTGSPSYLYIYLPGGFTGQASSLGGTVAVIASDGGGAIPLAIAYVDGLANRIVIHKQPAAPWAGTVDLWFSLVIGIQ